jgi:hypothetical protein
MLAQLLPGLREVRTPLACGYLWLLAAYFALYNPIPEPGHARGAVAAVYDLSALAGRPATLAAVTFAAYLVGILLTADPLSPGPIAGVFFGVTYLVIAFLKALVRALTDITDAILSVFVKRDYDYNPKLKSSVEWLAYQVIGDKLGPPPSVDMSELYILAARWARPSTGAGSARSRR